MSRLINCKRDGRLISEQDTQISARIKNDAADVEKVVKNSFNLFNWLFKYGFKVAIIVGILNIVFLASIAYIAVHFIAKWW